MRAGMDTLSAPASAFDWQTIDFVTGFAMVAPFLGLATPAYHMQGKGAATSNFQFNIDRDNAPRMLGQPLLHGGMFVRRIVVGNQMQRLVLGRLAINLAQELQPLGMRMALLAL